MICTIKHLGKWVRCLIEKVLPNQLCFCFFVEIGIRQFSKYGNLLYFDAKVRLNYYSYNHILIRPFYFRYIQFPAQAIRCR